MSIEVEEIIGVKRGGIYYTDEVTGTVGEGSITLEQLIYTDDADLKDKRINQYSARHVRSEMVIIRDKV